MRFVNTTTLQFVEIADSELGEEYPENRYAILSHRWGAARDEVLYADVFEERDLTVKPGYAKLKGFCDLAKSLGYDYAWDDTCCINKGDLNELSEAINSMYRWYQASGLCIIYLEDVGAGRKSMMDSEWFNRGWTLQELIGPENAAFYDHQWKLVGMKSDLLEELSAKTRIPVEVLSHSVSPMSCSIAQRMSWAAKRTTTRIEDRAYSLLGIFGVNMPQIYGEREKAFRRLQQAIVQQGKDESIFAWSLGTHDAITGLYASSPESFADCNDIVSTRGSTGFSENNGEITISLKTFPHSMETYYALLNCTRDGCPDQRISIVVSRTSTETDDEYVRVSGTYDAGMPLIGYSSPDNYKSRTIRVSVDPVERERPLNRVYGFWLRTIEPPGYEDYQIRVLSKDSSQSESDRVCMKPKDWGTAGVVLLEPKVAEQKIDNTEDAKGWSRIRWIKIGFDEDFNPVVLLANNKGPSRSTPPIHFRRDPELFEEAFAWGRAARPHHALFDNRWISCEGSVPSRLYGWAKGISILKVDKRKGMSGTLEALNVGIDIRLVSDISPHSSSSGGPNAAARQIWAVDIRVTGGNDPEKSVKEKKDADEGCEACCNMCCMERWERDALAEDEGRKRREARQGKVIGETDLMRRR